jgi:hypothetical protein
MTDINESFKLRAAFPPFESCPPQARWVGVIEGPSGHADITVVADTEESLQFRINTILQAFNGVPHGLMKR